MTLPHSAAARLQQPLAPQPSADVSHRGLRTCRASQLLMIGTLAAAIAGCSVGTGDAEPWMDDVPTGSSPHAPGPKPAITHWAFQSMSTAEPPEVSASVHAPWVKNGIDAFVVANLEQMGFAPSAVASPEKLIRRISLDLTGLPPTLEEVDAFVAAPTDEAYEALVDRLLASPRYAEHMTTGWLDLARYSDTDGFQYDMARPAWQWRDWVIQAFDENLPYDQFTTYQLAGDLLPEPTDSQLMATSFNRNHPIQGENGLLRNEFRDRYVTDRVETLGKAWLGLTLGCAKCHDHKYDPVTAVDFYSIYDCFNQTDEGDNGPSSEFRPSAPLDSPLKDQVLSDLDARIAALEAAGDQAINVAELRQERTAAEATATMRIMRDMDTKRVTQVLSRGRYDAPTGPGLKCSAPGFMPPFPNQAPPNRLGLAQWLMMPDNPLTHRVTVNRVWQQHFGRGLVPSIENFGVLTQAPRHLALLDWLAQRFVESGFDLKALHRLIVTSNTYRQASATTEASLAEDPANDLLGRGPRYRLPAEAIRDLPLFVSGLLVERVGGPPAYPYQPAGLWEELAWESYKISYPKRSGDSAYRRSVYWFWKRTLPPVMMSLFDAPDREYSATFREPGTSPQQALALMNDPAFLTAAATLGSRVLEDSAGDVDQAIADAFRRITSRAINESELTMMREVYESQLTLAGTGGAAGAQLSSDPELFAISQVVRVMFNLSETITLE